MNPSEYRIEYLTRLGNEVRRLRIEKGLSQDDLAQKCGYKSRSSINKIERGVYDLPLPKLKILSEALGVSPMHFLGIEVKVKESIELSSAEIALIEAYRSLNDHGKAKAFEYVSDLSGILKYTEKRDIGPRLSLIRGGKL